jgi:hypothetical protein
MELARCAPGKINCCETTCAEFPFRNSAGRRTIVDFYFYKEEIPYFYKYKKNS